LVRNLLEVPAEIDAGISMGTFIFNYPDFPMPVISDSGLVAEELAHPLIQNSQRVSNDFKAEQGNRVFIVTGANMAGKSTFLRALGVNMILAGMGAPVCAKKMLFTPVKILTGMRTTDSLADSESYFFAELKRLKMITETLNRGQKLMILLDEILKGTNSTDKHKGSVALVKQLVAHDCLAFIATHDLSLGEQEEKYPEAVRNYCFESYIVDGELIFDYKLKKGIAKNMNAYFLMQKMGIVRDSNTK
jgi:DNA mismatch repair ATPase MutS